MKTKHEFERISVKDLQFLKMGIEERIHKIETDLRAPLEEDEDPSFKNANRVLLSGILASEREYHMRVSDALSKRF